MSLRKKKNHQAVARWITFKDNILSKIKKKKKISLSKRTQHKHYIQVISGLSGFYPPFIYIYTCTRHIAHRQLYTEYNNVGAFHEAKPKRGSNVEQ